MLRSFRSFKICRPVLQQHRAVISQSREYRIWEENWKITFSRVEPIGYNSSKDKVILSTEATLDWLKNAHQSHDDFEQENSTDYNFPVALDWQAKYTAELEKRIRHTCPLQEGLDGISPYYKFAESLHKIS